MPVSALAEVQPGAIRTTLRSYGRRVRRQVQLRDACRHDSVLDSSLELGERFAARADIPAHTSPRICVRPDVRLHRARCDGAAATTSRRCPQKTRQGCRRRPPQRSCAHSDKSRSGSATRPSDGCCRRPDPLWPRLQHTELGSRNSLPGEVGDVDHPPAAVAPFRKTKRATLVSKRHGPLRVEGLS
jgi:hypothetical protein